MVNNKESTLATQPATSERVFKYINIVLLLVLAYCIPGFLAFREFSIRQGYHSFKLSSLSWSAVGFLGIFVLKYLYYYFMRDTIEAIIHPKYTGTEREYKLKAVLKLSFDTIFYLGTTIMAYSAFRSEYWFPSMLGGNGSCSSIYRDYPDWPAASISNLQIYYMVQLGVHAFSVFQMVVIKRGSDRKYHEFLLHHCVAVNLILFSMMCNEIAAGATILIAHDLSDVFAAFGRGFIETKYQIIWANISIYIVMTFFWIYTRHVVFPFCLISSVIQNIPGPSDEWYIISFEYNYLLSMTIVLQGMHMFWTYFLLRMGMKEAKWLKPKNIHEDKEQEEKVQ